MAIDITSTASLIQAVRTNPMAVQRTILEAFDKALDGEYDVVTASNPLMLGLEAVLSMGVAMMNNHESLLQMSYAELATTQESLYRHMSDADYIGRFATPAKAPIALLFLKDEIKNNAVKVGNTGVKKLVIPRNSYATVGDYTLSFQYPLEIRLLSHGGLQIVWDLDVASPLYTLDSNVVEWQEVETAAGTAILIEFPLFQFEVASNTSVLTSVAGFDQTYNFGDQYYHCRVYRRAANSTAWVECLTTHSDQVYDADNLTAVLEVGENELRVWLPQIYFSNGLATGELRVDIYTTKGALDVILTEYTVESYKLVLEDFDDGGESIYTAPFGSIKYQAVYSDGSLVGGTNGIGFDELRGRVINNETKVTLPITPTKLETSLKNLGYGLVKSVDQITNRIYLATKALPSYSGSTLYAGANCSVDWVTVKMSEMAKLPSVADNGNRITLKPTTLYKYNNGLVEVVSTTEQAILEAYDADALATAVNDGNYIFAPFHYVLDATENDFECRGYYLDNPAVKTRHFVMENDTAELEISTGSYTVEKTDDGYYLYVKVSSGDSYKALADSQVHCQLAFVPAGESDRAYLNGTLYGFSDDERVWLFKLTTNHDVNKKDQLIFNCFQMYENDPINFAAKLETKFELYHIVSDYTLSTYVPSAMDAVVSRYALPADSLPVVQEALTIRFGNALKQLWSNARSVVEEEDYLRYDADVMAYYEKNEYELDPIDGFPKVIVNDQGEKSLVLLHAKGDPVMVDGEHKVLHRATEIRLDENNDPIVKSVRGLKRELELFFIEGVFYFSTYAEDVAYRKTLAAQIVEYLEGDIADTSKNLLELTELYYYPKRTLGQTRVIVDDDVDTYINSNQSPVVRFYLGSTSYNNTALRATLTATAKKVLNAQIGKSSVSISEINEAMRTAMGADVVPVDISGLGNDGTLTYFTLYDDSSYCSVKRKLQVNPDESLQVVDDITVEFAKHGT